LYSLDRAKKVPREVKPLVLEFLRPTTKRRDQGVRKGRGKKKGKKKLIINNTIEIEKTTKFSISRGHGFLKGGGEKPDRPRPVLKRDRGRSRGGLKPKG